MIAASLTRLSLPLKVSTSPNPFSFPPLLREFLWVETAPGERRGESFSFAIGRSFCCNGRPFTWIVLRGFSRSGSCVLSHFPSKSRFFFLFFSFNLFSDVLTAGRTSPFLDRHFFSSGFRLCPFYPEDLSLS